MNSILSDLVTWFFHEQEISPEGIQQDDACPRQGGNGGAAHDEIRPGCGYKTRHGETAWPERAQARTSLCVILCDKVPGAW